LLNLPGVKPFGGKCVPALNQSIQAASSKEEELHMKYALPQKSLSFTPGFSLVLCRPLLRNRFNGFLRERMANR
jgi:hypothetical protein